MLPLTQVMIILPRYDLQGREQRPLVGLATIEFNGARKKNARSPRLGYPSRGGKVSAESILAKDALRLLLIY